MDTHLESQCKALDCFFFFSFLPSDFDYFLVAGPGVLYSTDSIVAVVLLIVRILSLGLLVCSI